MTKSMKNKFLTACLTVFAGAILTVSANGISQWVSKADETVEPTVAEFTADKLLMHGAMVRIENDGQNGIRFPVRMRVSDFETYSTLIEESGTVVRFGEVEQEVVTTNNWKEVTDDEKGETYMQTLVYVWNLPETVYNQDFYFKGYVKMKGAEERIYSQELDRSMSEVASAALDSGKYESATDVLQGFIRYNVTFADGQNETVVQAKYNQAVAMPEDPIPAKSYEFKYWATADGKEYDFASTVTEDITLTAVYEQVSRYEVTISDGTNIGAGIGLDTAYTKTDDELLYTTFEGSEVIELKMTSTGTTSGQVALVHFSREGAYATAIQQASGKKYIGFRIYSPVQGEALMEFLVHTGKGAYKHKWRLCYGWNEFSIDLNKYIADNNANFVASEENPIYRIGMGISDKVCGTVVGTTYSFYIDDIYATDYDVENIADFESTGDLNRYCYGEQVTSDYTYFDAHFGIDRSTASSGVDFDGQKTLKWTLTEAYGYLHLYAGVNNNYQQLWFPQDISGYKAIKIRVRAEDDKQLLKVSLMCKDNSTLINLAEIFNRSAEWTEYTIDLTAFTAEQLSQIKQLTFNTQGAGADATGKSIYFDYIQFVK